MPEHEPPPKPEDRQLRPPRPTRTGPARGISAEGQLQIAFAEVSRREHGMRTALENLLVGLDARASTHERLGNNEVRDETVIAADAIRGILANPTAALDD